MPEYDSNNEEKYCKNCGFKIEDDEFLRNPNTVYCRHCRLTIFDGPDIVDPEK